MSVGRKVGGAVERNRVKRRIREAFWSLPQRSAAGHDFVVVARPAAAELLEAEGFDGLQRDLAELGARFEAEQPEPPGASGMRRMATTVLLAPVRLYQRLISPLLPRRCKYEPTCSAYAMEAIRTYGPMRGTILAGWRLLRCNPLSHGGLDPVRAQRLFEVRQ